MHIATADQLLLDARLSPVQQRALVAWLAAAEEPGAPDLCERASKLFTQANTLTLID